MVQLLLSQFSLIQQNLANYSAFRGSIILTSCVGTVRCDQNTSQGILVGAADTLLFHTNVNLFFAVATEAGSQQPLSALTFIVSPTIHLEWVLRGLDSGQK